MADYRLYGFAESGNCYKVALMLALTGADWESVPVDYYNGETLSVRFLDAMNDMGEVPVLVHGQVRLVQSGVILDYLVEQTGQFGWRSDDERREILRWILFDNHKFTSYFATLRGLLGAPGSPDAAVIEFLRGRVTGAFQIVESRLGKGNFIVGGRPTIADLSLAGYVYYTDDTGIDRSRFPAISRWAERIAALPGWRPPFELMPRALAPR